MEWKHLEKGKGQIVQNFTEEFRKQAVAFNVPLGIPKILIKYVISLHNYFYPSL